MRGPCERHDTVAKAQAMPMLSRQPARLAEQCLAPCEGSQTSLQPMVHRTHWAVERATTQPYARRRGLPILFQPNMLHSQALRFHMVQPKEKLQWQHAVCELSTQREAAKPNMYICPVHRCGSQPILRMLFGQTAPFVPEY